MITRVVGPQFPTTFLSLDFQCQRLLVIGLPPIVDLWIR